MLGQGSPTQYIGRGVPCTPDITSGHAWRASTDGIRIGMLPTPWQRGRPARPYRPRVYRNARNAYTLGAHASRVPRGSCRKAGTILASGSVGV